MPGVPGRWGTGENGMKTHMNSKGQRVGGRGRGRCGGKKTRGKAGMAGN